jgi:hypothetical protein
VTREAHPAADLFPMMDGAELRALAADIAAHGQRHPILLDAEGRILDGRNREAACALAGVEPTYQSINGSDPLALVVSLNVRRRDLTAAQRAIAAAEAWGMIGGTREDSRAKKLARVFGVNNAYVSQARALVERDPVGAATVKAGGSLAEAYEALRVREGRATSDRAALERLRANHPDLAERVEAGNLTMAKATTEAADRERVAAERAERMTRTFAEALVALNALLDGDALAIREHWRPSANPYRHLPDLAALVTADGLGSLALLLQTLAERLRTEGDLPWT